MNIKEETNHKIFSIHMTARLPLDCHRIHKNVRHIDTLRSWNFAQKVESKSRSGLKKLAESTERERERERGETDIHHGYVVPGYNFY